VRRCEALWGAVRRCEALWGAVRRCEALWGAVRRCVVGCEQCSHPTTQRPTAATNHIQQNQSSTQYAVTHGLCSPEDGNNDARNMLRQKLITNTWLLHLVGFLSLYRNIRFFLRGWTTLVALSLFTAEISWSGTDTSYSMGLLWTSDRPVAETSSWQFTIDRQPWLQQAKIRRPKP